MSLFYSSIGGSNGINDGAINSVGADNGLSFVTLGNTGLVRLGGQLTDFLTEIQGNSFSAELSFTDQIILRLASDSIFFIEKDSYYGVHDIGGIVGTPIIGAFDIAKFERSTFADNLQSNRGIYYKELFYDNNGIITSLGLSTRQAFEEFGETTYLDYQNGEGIFIHKFLFENKFALQTSLYPFHLPSITGTCHGYEIINSWGGGDVVSCFGIYNAASEEGGGLLKFSATSADNGRVQLPNISTNDGLNYWKFGDFALFSLSNPFNNLNASGFLEVYVDGVLYKLATFL